ncbi:MULTISPECIES: hypothetical protein [unclassified Micromonospora]|uniref:hypothetical protein n=1 Tax=unclassified Micromonospora TaxID=2617518 RepID=UPI002FEF6537
MAFRTWGRLLLTAFGVSVLAGAGQLGIAYGFGIVRLNGAFTDVNRWPAQLAWVGWFAVTAAVVGAVVTVRLARRLGLPDRTGVQLAVSGAAALGATVVAPLCMQPARAAELSTIDPVWAVGICAIVGAVVGAGAASAVLLRPPLGWNVALLTGAVWLIALVSAAPAVLSTGALRSVRLGVLEPSWLDAGAAQRLAMLVLPAVALLAGATTGALARWRGHVPLVSGAAGAAGPVLLAFAYLTAGPGDAVDRYQLAPYYGAVIAVAAGALGSAAATLLRWPLFPAAGAEHAAGAHSAAGATTAAGAIEPTDILRPLPGSPAPSSASGDEMATVDLAGAAGAGTSPGAGTPTGTDRAATRTSGPTPAHWDWPVTPGTPTPPGTRPDSGSALDAPAVEPVSPTWPEPSGLTPDEPSYGDLPTSRRPEPETDAVSTPAAPQPRDRRGTPEPWLTADPAAPTSLAGHRAEPTAWEAAADREAPAESAGGVEVGDGADWDGPAGRITPTAPTGEPVVRDSSAPVPSDGSRPVDPVRVPETAGPVQVPPTSDPVQVPPAAGSVQVAPAADASDGPRAADPVRVARAADPADAPAAAGKVTVTPQVAPHRTEEPAATTDHTATDEQPHEQTAVTADRAATAEPAEATTTTAEPAEATPVAPRPRPKRNRKSHSAGPDEPVAATSATSSDAGSDNPVAATFATTSDAGSDDPVATTGAGPTAATTAPADPAAAPTGSAVPAAATDSAAAGTGRKGSAKRAVCPATDPTAAPEPADSPTPAPVALSGADSTPAADPQRALDRNRLDRPELDTAGLGEAGHDTTEPEPATPDPARFDPATPDPARAEDPSTASTKDDASYAPDPRPDMRASGADRISARHTPPTAAATPAAEPAPRPRHQLPDLNSAVSWNAFTAPRPAPAPPRADLPFPDHGPEEEPKPVTFRWDADDARPGTPGTASRSTDLPAAEVPADERREAEPRRAEQEPKNEREPAADRSRPKRSLFRRNKARAAEPPAEAPEAEPLAAQDEEYVDWVAGLSRPLADNEPETESGRRSLRSSGRHHRD